MIHIYSPMQLHSSIIITPMQCIGAMQLHCCFPYIIVFPAKVRETLEEAIPRDIPEEDTTDDLSETQEEQVTLPEA